MDAQAKHAFHKPLVEKGLGFMVAGLRDHGYRGKMEEVWLKTN